MVSTAAAAPRVALIAGVLILVMPRLLNLVIAMLNAMYHWVQITSKSRAHSNPWSHGQIAL
jgi:Protein of unknown function (DUF3096)